MYLFLILRQVHSATFGIIKINHTRTLRLIEQIDFLLQLGLVFLTKC